MEQERDAKTDQAYLRRAVEVFILIGVILILVLWSFRIILPFALPVVWAGIISVALHQLFRASLDADSPPAPVDAPAETA